MPRAPSKRLLKSCPPTRGLANTNAVTGQPVAASAATVGPICQDATSSLYPSSLPSFLSPSIFFAAGEEGRGAATAVTGKHGGSEAYGRGQRASKRVSKTRRRRNWRRHGEAGELLPSPNPPWPASTTAWKGRRWGGRGRRRGARRRGPEEAVARWLPP